MKIKLLDSFLIEIFVLAFKKQPMLKDKLSKLFEQSKTRFALIWAWIKDNKIKSIGIAIAAGILSVLLLIFFIYLGLFGKLPTEGELKEIKNPLATNIYSGNKEIIGHFYVQNRSNIDSTQINDFVKNALIATEDVRFEEHGGVDMRSLARVFVKTLILSKKSSGGGSTITQQLAKNVFGRKKQYFFSTPINKIREMFIAKRLEKVYSKDEILLLYLNTVPFGEKLYGIEKASQRFFNKSPEKLKLDEAATIIGILKATTFYNPRKNPDNSFRRRNTVLSQMKKYGYIDEETYDNTIKERTELKYTLPKVESTFAAHYKEYLRKEFDLWAADNPKEDGSFYNLDLDGLKIYTSIHSSIQKSAEKAVESQMKNLQKYFETGWDATVGKEQYIENLIWRHPKAKALENEISKDSIISIFNKKRIRDYWNGYEFTKDSISMLDSMVAEAITLQTGLIAMHTGTGKIMAYVGGRDFGYSQYDNIQIPKQVGSTFKPFAYLGALEVGAQPCDYYDNDLRTYSSFEGWTPRNADGKYGGSYSMFGALANSINSVSVQVMFQAGVKNVINIAKSFGITSDLPKVPSLVLGTAEISLQEMVTAYGAIANGGTVMKPYSIVKIENEAGDVLYESKPQYNMTVKAAPENLDKLRRMMTYVNKVGTGTRIKSYNIPYNLIGKSGTTQSNADGWYIASTPEIVCGSWVGTLDPGVNFKYTSMGSGSNTALPMVARVFGDLSMWKSQIISNFEFTTEDFYCIPYSELTAEEAKTQGMFSKDNIIDGISNFFKDIFGKRDTFDLVDTLKEEE